MKEEGKIHSFKGDYVIKFFSWYTILKSRYSFIRNLKIKCWNWLSSHYCWEINSARTKTFADVMCDNKQQIQLNILELSNNTVKRWIAENSDCINKSNVHHIIKRSFCLNASLWKHWHIRQRQFNVFFQLWFLKWISRKISFLKSLLTRTNCCNIF